MIENIGFIAGLLTTGSFIPQVIKVYKTKSAGDISTGMLAMLLLGISLWISYGFVISSTPVVLWNMVSFNLVAALFAGKIKYGGRK
jgi:MtN3 and saliva related transmembrane protein